MLRLDKWFRILITITEQGSTFPRFTWDLTYKKMVQCLSMFKVPLYYIALTCMLYLLKEVALRHNHYICLFLLVLTYILRWIPLPAKKHIEKKCEELFFFSLHYISSKFFGTFSISILNYDQWWYWRSQHKQLQLDYWVNPSLVVDWHLQ